MPDVRITAGPCTHVQAFPWNMGAYKGWTSSMFLPASLPFAYISRMGEAATVYAKELHRLRYGHPLWWPEHTRGPGGRERAIEIGDVGYIDSAGAFHPLFNEQTEHEFNANRSPPNYTPFSLGAESIERKHSFLQRGPLHSTSVRGYKIQPEIAVYVVWNVFMHETNKGFGIDRNPYPVRQWRCLIGLNAGRTRGQF